MLRICACCGVPFDAINHRQRFCQNCKDTYKDKPPVHQKQKFCPVCNEPFVPINKKMIYCSEKCKMRNANKKYHEIQKAKREKEKAEKAKKKQKKPTVNTVWWRTFERADLLTKDAMLARRFGYASYASFITAVNMGKEDRQMLIIAAMMEEREKEERSKKDEDV